LKRISNTIILAINTIVVRHTNESVHTHVTHN